MKKLSFLCYIVKGIQKSCEKSNIASVKKPEAVIGKKMQAYTQQVFSQSSTFVLSLKCQNKRKDETFLHLTNLVPFLLIATFSQTVFFYFLDSIKLFIKKPQTQKVLQ